MIRSLRLLLPVIGRWPRRIAALACLLLAAGSALAGHRSPASARPPAALHPTALTASLSGQVAVPVTLSAAGGRFIHPGDRIGLLAAPGSESTSGRAEFVADQVPVLAVPPAAALGATPDAVVILVSTSRDAALRIAALGQGEMLAVLEESS